MKPICVPCRRFYRPKKNGYPFIEGMPADNSRPQAGLAEPEKWKPYKLWNGDLWECPDCHAEIIVGFARQPWAEHYQSDFAKKVESEAARVSELIQINDC